MRLSQCLIVSRLGSSIVSRPRAHAYSASGGHVRGTSHIAIGEMAEILREIMVRNVVFGDCGSPGGLAPPRLGGTPRPTVHTSLHDFPMATLFRSNTTDEFLGDQGTYCNINRIFIDA